MYSSMCLYLDNPAIRNKLPLLCCETMLSVQYIFSPSNSYWSWPINKELKR